jgi:hypothetical protein
VSVQKVVITDAMVFGAIRAQQKVQEQTYRSLYDGMQAALVAGFTAAGIETEVTR